MKKEGRENIKRYKAGLFIFLIANGSFVFLLFSPYITNLFGQWADDAFLENIDEKIREVRTDIFSLTMKYENGTLINNTLINYNLIRHEFIFGCNIYQFNITGSSYGNEKYTEYFKQLFNLAVIRFYWSGYEPSQGVYPNDDWINDTINWCRLNNITTKGHPLAWRNPSGYPTWLPDDKSQVVDLLKSRIERIMNLYKEKIDIWDVVNEPTHLPPIGDQTLEQYITNCFNWVNNIDSNVLLTLNDYGIIGHDFGSGPYYNLISNLKSQNVPVDIIGLQGREPRTDWIPATEIWSTLEAYSKLGLPLHITELTWPSTSLPITNSWKKGLWNQENQAEYAERYYKTAFSHPSVDAIIWWDLWDGASWVQEGGLINRNWESKPIYNRLDNLINSEWHTQGSGDSNSNGRLEFEGFFGTYNITIPSLGFNDTINALSEGSREIEIIIP